MRSSGVPKSAIYVAWPAEYFIPRVEITLLQCSGGVAGWSCLLGLFDERRSGSNFRPTAASTLGARVQPEQLQGEPVRGLGQEPRRPLSQCDLLTNQSTHRLTNCNLLDHRLQSSCCGRKKVRPTPACYSSTANKPLSPLDFSTQSRPGT